MKGIKENTVLFNVMNPIHYLKAISNETGIFRIQINSIVSYNKQNIILRWLTQSSNIILTEE